MKARVVVQVTIDAAPAEVFKYLADLSYGPLWMPNLISIKPRRVLKQGDTYEIKSLIFGVPVEGRNEVLSLVENKHITLVNETGALKYRIDHRLKGGPRKTVLITSVDVQTESRSFAFAKSVIRPMAQRYTRSELNMLKIAVEEGLRPDS